MSTEESTNVNSKLVTKNKNKLDALEKEIEELEKGEGQQGSPVKEAEGTSQSTDPSGVESAPEVVSEPQLSREEETFKKRYADLQRHLQKQKEQWEAEKEELKGRGATGLPVEEEDVEKWVKDHPQVAAIVQSLARREAESKASSKFRETEELTKSLLAEKYKLAQEKAEQAIVKAHPDFQRIREDNTFHDWASLQPKVIQDALYENSDDPDSVISVLDLYKLKKTSKDLEKSSETDAAFRVTNGRGPSVTDGSGAPKWSESKVDKLSAKEYEKYAADIDKAVAEGNFLYDMGR